MGNATATILIWLLSEWNSYLSVKICLPLVVSSVLQILGHLKWICMPWNSTSEGFWELLQSFSFTYATINEDIYATLCVDIIRRRNHVHMLYVQCCYTWYFKNLFLLGLSFLHGSKYLKKMIEGTTKIRIGNQSWQVWVYLLSRYKYQNFLLTNIDCNRDVGVRTALTMMKNW